MDLGLDPIQHVLSYLPLRECVEYATTSKAIAALVQRIIAARGVEWGVGRDGKVRALWSELPLFALFAPAWIQYGDARDREATLLALRALPLGDLIGIFSHHGYHKIAETMPLAQKSVLAGAHKGTIRREQFESALSQACHESNCDAVIFLLDRCAQMRSLQQIYPVWCLRAAIASVRWTHPASRSVQLAEWLFDRGVLTAGSCDEEARTLLHHACMTYNVALGNFLLARGADPNAEDGWGKSPLLHALDSLTPKVELVTTLLKGGADPNRLYPAWGLPLQHAKNCHLAQLLLEYGAQPDLQDSLGRTALHHLVSSPSSIALLLRWGANPHCIDGDGLTPLHYAVKRGHGETVELLFDAGGSLDQRGDDGQSAFELASCTAIKYLLIGLGRRRLKMQNAPRGNVQYREMLLEGEMLLQGDAPHFLPLVLQIDDLVQLILSYLRVAEWASLSPLSKTTSHVTTRLMAQRAKEWGVASAQETQQQQRAALRALWSELPVVSLFAPPAIQRRTRQMDPEALLHYLHALSFASCARLFLWDDYMDASPRLQHVEASLFAAPRSADSVGVDELSDREIEQLLKRAGTHDHSGLVHFLMRYGALEKGAYLDASAHLSLYLNNPTLVTLLLKLRMLTLDSSPPLKQELLYRSICTNNAALASLLLQGGADPNHRKHAMERTLLFFIFLPPPVHHPILVALLEAGANPNLTDLDNRTPLFYTSHPLLIGLLLEHGAWIDQRDRKGKTPLYAHIKNGSFSGIALLLQRGADPNATTLKGKRPLDIAKRPEVIELLLAAGATHSK